MVAELRAKVDRPMLLPHIQRKGVNYEKRKETRRHTKEKLANSEKLDLLVPSSDGKPRSVANLNRREFKDVLKLAGLDVKNASILAENLNPKQLQQRLGHASLTTALKFYVHVGEDSQQSATDKLAGLLYG